MRDRRVLLQQMFDALLGPPVERQFRPSPDTVEEGCWPLFDEPAYNRVNGGARTEEDTGDLGWRVAIGGEQHYVHPEPAAGFSLALHLPDEALALFGGDGDTLHGRPFL